MKNRFYLIGLIVVLTSYLAMVAKPAYADFMDAAILGPMAAVQTAIQATQAAFQDWFQGYTIARDVVNDKLANLNKTLASQAVDQDKIQNEGTDNLIGSAPLITGAEDQQKAAQQANKEAADKNNAAMLKAIEDTQPNPTDCINYTTAMLAVYSQNQSLKYVQQLMTNDMGYIKNGSPPTTVNANISNNINQAIANVDSTGKMTTQNLIPYQPDENVVLQSCLDNNCYNNWVIQQENNWYQQTAGNKYPSNSANNPAMSAYRIQYAAWLAERSKNRKTIALADTRVMFKYPDNYTQALYAIETNMNKTPAEATALLSFDPTKQISGLYPHSDKVGLTAKEMDEAIYYSLLNKPSTEDNSVDQKALEHAKANYDADEELYRQHELAMDKIVSPPALSASALSVNSGTTAAPAAAAK